MSEVHYFGHINARSKYLILKKSSLKSILHYLYQLLTVPYYMYKFIIPFQSEFATCFVIICSRYILPFVLRNTVSSSLASIIIDENEYYLYQNPNNRRTLEIKQTAWCDSDGDLMSSVKRNNSNKFIIQNDVTRMHPKIVSNARSTKKNIFFSLACWLNCVASVLPTFKSRCNMSDCRSRFSLYGSSDIYIIMKLKPSIFFFCFNCFSECFNINWHRSNYQSYAYKFPSILQRNYFWICWFKFTVFDFYFMIRIFLFKMKIVIWRQNVL